VKGEINRWDVLRHAPLIIRDYGLSTFLIALFGDYPTFLSVVFR
jgi:hypothetical protein